MSGAFRSTAAFGFTLIDYNIQGWHTYEYDNWRKLDSLLSSSNTSDIPFGIDTGTTNAFIVDYTPDITYTAGQRISFKSLNENTGPSTINVDGLGIKNIVRLGAPLIGGEIPVNAYVLLIYNGSEFELLAPTIEEINVEDGSITPVKLSVGGPTWNTSGDVDISGDTTADGTIIGNALREGNASSSKKALVHTNDTYTSGNITFSTSDPSGGNDGDIWFKYTA